MSAPFDPGWFVPADEFLARLDRELRHAGATFDDIDDRMVAALGVSREAWSGYAAVKWACERYQAQAARARGRCHGDGPRRE